MLTARQQVLSLVLLVLVAATAASSTTDLATGISFPASHNGLSLFGVGVRKKGPIKIYSVACYGDASVKEKMSSISKSDGKGKVATETLRKNVPPASFILKMNFKVGAEKMAVSGDEQRQKERDRQTESERTSDDYVAVSGTQLF